MERRLNCQDRILDQKSRATLIYVLITFWEYRLRFHYIFILVVLIRINRLLMKSGEVKFLSTSGCFFVIIFLVSLGGLLYSSIAILQTYSLIPSTGYIRYWEPLPWLHVEGRYIKNEAGQIVNLTGVNFVELGYPQSSYGGIGGWDGSLGPRCWRFGPPDVSSYTVTSEQIAQYMAAKWKGFGINSVRLLLNWYTWRNLEEWNRAYRPFPGYIPSIDAIVSACARNQIYVILTFLEYQSKEFDGTWNTPATFKIEWINWLVEVATRYKDEPAVAGIDILNEPRPDQWGSAEVFYSAALEAARAIRNVNPNILIIVQTGLELQPRWQRFDPYLIDNPIHTQVSNVVYEFHRYYRQEWYYRSWSSIYPYIGGEPTFPPNLDYPTSYKNGNYTLARQQIEQVYYNELFYVLEKGYCLWNGEFGFGQGSDPNSISFEPAWDVALKDRLQILNKYGIGWSYYAWFGSGQTYGMLVEDPTGHLTLYNEPKASILRENLLPLPVP